jgi:hypothetical protein
MQSVEKWYLPMWSKLHSYRIARDVLQKDQISEKELKASCFVFMKDGSLHGFDKITDFKVEPDGQSLGFTTSWKGIFLPSNSFLLSRE